MNETRDWPKEWPPHRIAEVAQVAEARYLEPLEPVHLALPERHEPIVPRTIIEVGGMFVVAAVGEPDDWYMGQRGSDGQIECWGQYGDLATALRGL